MLKLQCITVDAHNPELLSAFWHGMLGGKLDHDGDEQYWLEFEAGTPDILFLKTPDDKVFKNRLHFDLRPSDQAAEIEKAVLLGATRVNIGQKGDESWKVMADVEGNEFCILAARPN